MSVETKCMVPAFCRWLHLEPLKATGWAHRTDLCMLLFVAVPPWLQWFCRDLCLWCPRIYVSTLHRAVCPLVSQLAASAGSPLLCSISWAWSLVTTEGTVLLPGQPVCFSLPFIFQGPGEKKKQNKTMNGCALSLTSVLTRLWLCFPLSSGLTRLLTWAQFLSFCPLNLPRILPHLSVSSNLLSLCLIQPDFPVALP